MYQNYGDKIMKCPNCGCLEDKVIDSRLSEDGISIRRRRECISCAKRFTTYETIETLPIYIVKKTGVREPFDINKIKTGILKACEKRPVPITEIDKLVADIEKKVTNSLQQEISSHELGNMVMAGLKKIDDVAYVRFSVVYKEFKDLESWFQEMESYLNERK